MKSIHCILLVFIAVASASAQQGKVLSAWNAMNLYEQGGSAEDLERGKQPIDEAVVDPATMNSGKAWWYRAKLYTMMLQDKTLSAKYPNLATEIVQSFKMLNQVNDPKFKDWDDAAKSLQAVTVTLFNGGYDHYKANAFAMAYDNFMTASEAVAVLTARNKQSPVPLADCYRNAALSAENLKDLEKAENAITKVIAIAPDAKTYNLLAYYQKKNGKIDAAKATTEQGLAKFPSDLDLLIGKIQFFLDENKEDQAINYLNEAIKLDPKNSKLYLVLGNALDKIGKAEDSKAAYEQAIKVDPQNFDAYYNIASVLNNKAVKVNEQMNELGMSKADQAKAEELKKVRDQYFRDAKPYLLEAKKLKPDDPQVNRFLKQIELYTGE